LVKSRPRGDAVWRKIRIHQLAKELGITNNELIGLLRELGEDVKSHSSTIDEATADAVRELLREKFWGETYPTGCFIATPSTATT
jgi:hypothetical protein